MLYLDVFRVPVIRYGVKRYTFDVLVTGDCQDNRHWWRQQFPPKRRCIFSVKTLNTYVQF